MKVLLLGYGNPGRGDDGLGPELVEALEPRFPHVEAQVAMQLQPEHALDLAACELALLVDAGVGTSPPWTFERLLAQSEPGAFSHALSPKALLWICAKILGAAPPVFLLTVAGVRFELGVGLSPKARRNFKAALGLAKTLLGRPELKFWDEVCRARAVPG
ncbi:hydrogenase [Methylothermus subterraneus]